MQLSHEPLISCADFLGGGGGGGGVRVEGVLKFPEKGYLSIYPMA